MNDVLPAARVRLLLGVMQGGLLYWLYQRVLDHSWPAGEPLVFAPALLWSVLVPLLANSAWGRMSMGAWLRWLLVAGSVVLVLGCYDIWRLAPGATGALRFPSASVWVSLVAGLFMAHTLVLAGAHERRCVASYSTYFDQAWKLGIQHLFSAAFVGALWLVLGLGAALFHLIGLEFVQRLLRESWFAIPVSTFAAACALHLTDVKPDIVKGIRGLILALLSWILPVITLLSGGFLLSLPFTGLEPLWATRHAAAVLLSTAATLVVLINTAFQNGDRVAERHRVVRDSARLGCVLLLPISGLALYALGLRVGQHGWSVDRVVAAACVLVAACYALGYAWAAVSRGEAWLGPVAKVNVWVTWLILGVLVALLSPVADPARLAVSDQLARLKAGRVTAADFDYRYLRFDAGRYGQDALRDLAAQGGSGPQAVEVTRYAQAALQRTSAWNARRQDPALDAQGIRDNIKAVWPEGQRLPESFLRTPWQGMEGGRVDWRLPECLRKIGSTCEAVLLHLRGEDTPEVLILQARPSSAAVVLAQDLDQSWRVLATLPSRLASCESERERLRRGQFDYVAPRQQDLRLGEIRIAVRPDPAWDDLWPPSREAGCR